MESVVVANDVAAERAAFGFARQARQELGERAVGVLDGCACVDEFYGGALGETGIHSVEPGHNVISRNGVGMDRLTDQEHSGMRGDSRIDERHHVDPILVNDGGSAQMAASVVGHARGQRVPGERDHDDCARCDLDVLGQPITWRRATEKLWDELSAAKQRAEILGGLLCERVPDEDDVG